MKLLSIIFISFVSCLSVNSVSAQTIVASALNINLNYQGRIKYNKVDNTSEIFWPGTSITLNFKGTAVSASLKDISGDNYFYAIIDGKDDDPLKIKLDKNKKSYLLAANLANKKHTVELFKLTNPTKATIFYDFQISGSNSRILKPNNKPERKIEFYGNSITVGQAVDLKDADDSQDFKYYNNYHSYASITARHFNAQYSCIAKSGIGITVSWFPETMPDIYDRLDLNDENSRWDFSQYIPNVVVINLLQNDYKLTTLLDHPQFKAKFGNTPPTKDFIFAAYSKFLRTIRAKYPKATIICVLGSMNAVAPSSKYPEYIKEAVSNMHDDKIMCHFFNYKYTPGHPKIKEQSEMAISLINFINKNVKW